MADFVERRTGERRKGPIRSGVDRRKHKLPAPEGSPQRSGYDRRRRDRRSGRDRRQAQ